MALKSKIKLNQQSSNDDLLLEFSNIQFFVIANPDTYDDNAVSQIEKIVDVMSKHIYIDKSYVDFPENKHCDVFLELDGWQNMCKLIKKTKYGKISSNSADEILHETFKLIVVAYMYSVLEKFNYNIEDIQLDIVNGSGLDVRYYEDKIQEWKHYLGPWQEWNSEDSEHE